MARARVACVSDRLPLSTASSNSSSSRIWWEASGAIQRSSSRSTSGAITLGIVFVPLHRLQDVDVVPGPAAVRSIEAADIVRLSLKQEPDDVVSALDDRLSGVVERLRGMCDMGHDDDVAVGMQKMRVKGDAPISRSHVVECDARRVIRRVRHGAIYGQSQWR